MDDEAILRVRRQKQNRIAQRNRRMYEGVDVKYETYVLSGSKLKQAQEDNERVSRYEGHPSGPSRVPEAHFATPNLSPEVLTPSEDPLLPVDQLLGLMTPALTSLSERNTTKEHVLNGVDSEVSKLSVSPIEQTQVTVAPRQYTSPFRLLHRTQCSRIRVLRIWKMYHGGRASRQPMISRCYHSIKTFSGRDLDLRQMQNAGMKRP